MNSTGIIRSSLFVVAVSIAFSSVAQATPYASGVSEGGGNVSFVLNEDADAVTIKRSGDTDLVLGALTKGSHSFALPAGAYDIEVSKSTAAAWIQTSTDTDTGSQYFSPRGVAINRNASSSNFGNIYVAEGAGGLAQGTRDTLDGIFAMAADQSDTIVSGGQGDDGFIGGMDTTSSNSPFKITVAPDDTVYISDWSDATGGVWRAPADLDESSNWPNVLANDNRVASGLTDNHGSIPSIWVEGTGASTKLYTMDEDWPDASGISAEGRGDIFRYDIGTTTNYTGAGVVQVDDDTPSPSGVILNGLMDFVRDEDGTWWISQFRADDEKTIPALSHWADGGTEPLWTSGKNSREDGDADWDSDVDGADFLTWQQNNGTIGTGTVWNGDANLDTNIDNADEVLWEGNFGNNIPGEVVLDGTYGIVDIHDGLNLLAVGARYGNGVYIVDISDSNAPELLATIPQSGTTNDVSFDAAGNVYIVNRSTETLRIWSPGGDSLATTSSAGTFTLTQPGPAVAAVVPEPTSLALGVLGLVGLACGRRRVRS